MKTFLKWSGNKSKYIKYIEPFLPVQYKTYIEPFLGSGAIFLYLHPEKWIINDLNKDLISIWKLVANNPQLLIESFKNMKHRFINFSNEKKLSFCRKKTEKLNTEPPSDQRTISILFMMYCCYMGQIYHKDRYYFNGLELNISVGNRYAFFQKSYYDNILEISEYLAKGKIYNMDYKQILKKSKKGDFVFLDPPYIEKTIDYKFRYNINEILNIDFIKELLKEVQILDDKGVLWMMTQADTPDIRKIFKNYVIVEFPVFRARTSTKKKELLIMNYVI